MGLKGTTSRTGAGLAGVLAFTGAVLFAGQTVTLAQAPAAPKVEVRGVRIVGDGYGDGMKGLRPFNWSKGTALALLVTKPDGGLVKVVKAEATTFVDDKGTNLAPPMQPEGFMMSGGMSQVSPDGKACMAESSGDGIPAKGASAISATGTVLLKCGSRKETARQENVVLNPGVKVAAGPVQFEIKKIGKPQMMFGFGGGEEQKDAWQVTLQAKQDLSSVAAIKFLDAAGNEMKATDSGTNSISFGPMVSVEKSFILPKKADSATIAITYWADMKEVSVPFDVKATLGLE